MNIEELREHLISKVGTTEGMPFGEDVLVYKVGGKIYALLTIETGNLNLKCEPERAVELREEHPYIIPGYHMNKKHWNTILTTEGITDALLIELIDHSYDLIVKRLPVKVQKTLYSEGE